MSGNLWRIGPRSGGLHQSTTQCDSDGCTRVAVIDPEDAEQVERLMLLFARNRWGSRDLSLLSGIVSEAQAALREYADPTPPRPDEPAGLGAVVEDEGRRWTRYQETTTKRHWHPSDGRGFERHWGEFTTSVRVLSEGVTA